MRRDLDVMGLKIQYSRGKTQLTPKLPMASIFDLSTNVDYRTRVFEDYCHTAHCCKSTSTATVSKARSQYR